MMNDLKHNQLIFQIVLGQKFDFKNKNIDLMQEKIKDLNNTIRVLEAKIESNERSQYKYNLTTTQNEDNLRKLQRIIENLPQLSKKLAFINQEYIDKSRIELSLDYVEWFSDEEAKKAAKEDDDEYAASLSNGFYIRNKHNENQIVNINDDTLIYVFEGAASKLADFSSFINKADSLKDRLFRIYSISNKILILEEQYRP